eukprot:771587-Pyramimonas_sp.AAC.1
MLDAVAAPPLTTVDTRIPFSAQRFEYSVECSAYIPCRQTAIGWPTVDSGAWDRVCKRVPSSPLATGDAPASRPSNKNNTALHLF